MAGLERQSELKPYMLPDSKHGLCRVWCSRCGAPMRVCAKDVFLNPMFGILRTHYCERCDPKPPPLPRAGPMDDHGPWQDIAIRCMEDG